jgi:uncharacterized protein (DUF1330 family)
MIGTKMRVIAALLCATPMLSFGVHARAAAVYVVNEIDVTDPAGFRSYADQQGTLVQSFGGRFLARGGAAETIAGAKVEPRITIYVFESMERLEAWQSAPAQKQLADLRDRSSHFRSYAVEGLPN